MSRTHIKKVLNYIEEHLKDDRQGVLDNETLARIAGYSEYHFIRLFRETVHLTPADYIRKRRISEIVRRMGEGSQSMSDIAFEYGFNSKENFTRAFKNEHRILPSEFRTANCSLKLFAPFDPDPSEPRPEVSLLTMEAFSLTVFPSDEQSPPHFWNKYNTEKRSERLTGHVDAEDFGVMIPNPGTGRLDYYIGVRSEEARGDTSGTIRLEIAEGLYAVFRTPPADQHTFISTVQRTWDWIYRTWLPANGFARGEGFELESYVESGRTYSEKIYIPIKPLIGDEVSG